MFSHKRSGNYSLGTYCWELNEQALFFNLKWRYWRRLHIRNLFRIKATKLNSLYIYACITFAVQYVTYNSSANINLKYCFFLTKGHKKAWLNLESFKDFTVRQLTEFWKFYKNPTRGTLQIQENNQQQQCSSKFVSWMRKKQRKLIS